MSLPGARKAHKIEHLCCRSGGRFKNDGPKHLRQCTGCQQTSMMVEKSAEYAQWLQDHRKCFEDIKPVVLEDSGTQAEYLVATKQGKVGRARYNKFGPRNARYTWEIIS